ncbi:MAG: hypothetical protein EOP82_19340 [Variovorax sp.]|nr:MAG: hypothetical protein EOP82_19340 [Variovorax sp.]
MLVGAAVKLTCANGTTLTGSTNGNGAYTTNQAGIAYPCVGTATSGAITYRGILFSGSTTNFTPLTEMLVQVVLAASASGNATLTQDQFLAKASADGTFAANVTSATAITAYRNAVLDVAKAQLIEGGKTAAEADAILASAANFDSVAFALGSPLDKVLDNTASVLQNADGTVKSDVLADAQAAGNLLPTPTSGATGATGASGG